MKFGQVSNPEDIDFSLPADAKETKEVLQKHKGEKFDASVGCAKWNKTDLKGFYPKGTKDELAYYGTQFNSVELNATFYHSPTREQVLVWKEKTPENFKFFPKITNTVSHYRRLLNIKEPLDQFCDAVSNFEEQLGMVFLQLHDNFKPKDFDRLENFVKLFPKALPLGVELRNEEWFTDEKIADRIFELFQKNNITNIIVDTAGRRDMLHMKLSTPKAFIRYVGANHKSDYTRLDEWVERIKLWHNEGLQELDFFVHQNIEKASPLLSAHFIKKLNEALKLDLTIPKLATDEPTLF
ncbi:hypothetical protein BCY91_14210 [Pelobium manganitolerans]|uniref:DUF72 domain-containing protein n=1 Tax=Pelobium manganitolerans TaxID=1842495 RepID=A0A419SA10_9SPHI|nr:DUF72 domain-containing protein [Pelobium manganitolerans]RKD19026.1 hypothetical protein BCY91_14210 [Pelobium manganitolerans]